MPTVRPLLLLEINEIPWRLVDRYRRTEGYPNLRLFFDRAETHTTQTVDTGTLQPWVTWPTFHRGISNEEHGIRNLGQDPSSFRGTTIWDEFRKRGLSVGICGSLQSWPPQDPGAGGFWVPDTFAQDERCIPSFVEPLQRFNLGLVRQNGRVVSSRLGSPRNLLDVALALPRLGLRVRTLRSLVRQLVDERRDRTFVARRPIFQSILFWDVFRKLYDAAHPPAFASFFTNHVAGVMHRYWKHVFPEDFKDVEATFTPVHAPTMDFAMRLVDDILGDAMAFQRRNPELCVVFATSMGQHAVEHDWFEGYEAAIQDLGRLLDACGAPRAAWEQTLAMVPEASLNCPDPVLRQKLAGVLRAATVPSGKALFWVDEIGESLTLMVHVPRLAEIERGVFRMGSIHGGDPRELRFADGGIAMLAVEKGSGHHMPEGILACYGRGIEPADRRTPMKATEAKRLLMEYAHLA